MSLEASEMVKWVNVGEPKWSCLMHMGVKAEDCLKYNVTQSGNLFTHISLHAADHGYIAKY